MISKMSSLRTCADSSAKPLSRGAQPLSRSAEKSFYLTAVYLTAGSVTAGSVRTHTACMRQGRYAAAEIRGLTPHTLRSEASHKHKHTPRPNPLRAAHGGILRTMGANAESFTRVCVCFTLGFFLGRHGIKLPSTEGQAVLTAALQLEKSMVRLRIGR